MNSARAQAVLRTAADLGSGRTWGWAWVGAFAAANVILLRDGWTFGGILAVIGCGLWAGAALLLGMVLGPQNHPQLARLVPGQLATLRQTLRWGVGLLLAIGVAFGWMWTGPDGHKLALMTLMLVTLLWLLTCLGLSRWMWLPVPVALLGALVVTTKLSDVPAMAPAVAPALALIAVATLLWGAPKMLRTGDAAHSRAHEARRRLIAIGRASSEGGSTGAYYRVGWTAAFMHAWLLPLRKALRRHAARPVRNSADAIGRALWLVSPSMAAAQQAWGLLLLSALLLLLPWAVLLELNPSQGDQAMPAAWPVGVLQGLFLLTLNGCRVDHWSGRQGQALLRLTPRQPLAADLARAWQAVLLRHGAVGWVLHSGLALAVVWLAEPGAWLAAGVGCLMALPVLATTVRTDWARMPRPLAPSPERSWLSYANDPGLQGLGQAALCAVPALLWPHYGDHAAFEPALLALALACLATTAWRLRPTGSPQQAPWPAGRWSA